MLNIKKYYKMIKRNFMVIVILLIWAFVLNQFLNEPENANWPFAIITTTIMIYLFSHYSKKEEIYKNTKQNIKLLSREYKRNIDLARRIDQQRKCKKIQELPFSTYSTKCMNKIIEEGMIKDKNLLRRINSEVNRLSWFNKVWSILAEEVLLDNKKLENKIRKYLRYNDEEIYKKLRKTKELIKIYFKREFCEVLKE